LDHRGVIGEVRAGRALPLEHHGETKVHVGGRRGDAVGEGGAVGAAVGVGSEEHDEVVDAEALLAPKLPTSWEKLKDGGGRNARVSLFSSDTRGRPSGPPVACVVHPEVAEKEAGGELDDAGARGDARAGPRAVTNFGPPEAQPKLKAL